MTTTAPAATSGLLFRCGDFLRRRQAWLCAMQWAVVAIYLVLVVAPALLPLPPEDSHLWNNLTRFAQFVFWGLWWPGVMVATVAFGRVWCGILCPEGTLSEWASRHGRGATIPRWMRWGGWPFVAFLGTTVYGQLVSVYEYPQAALLVLGGSTAAAVAVGLLYGKGKRVWCRYLCPANGIFALLAKIAPMHYRVDREIWDRAPRRTPAVNCAPLIDMRRMTSASDCHACGRCNSHRDAVALSWRAPWAEILDPALPPGKVEVATLLFGVLGVATAAFQWSSSPWYVSAKLAVADWLVERGFERILQDDAPWWLLTHVPAANDVFTWLDGALILAYLLGGGFVLGGLLGLAVFAAARIAGRTGPGSHRLALALVPIAAANVIVGLTMLTASHLKAEQVPVDWLALPRMALLAGGSFFALGLAWRLLSGVPVLRRLPAVLVFALAPVLVTAAWGGVFFVW